MLTLVCERAKQLEWERRGSVKNDVFCRNCGANWSQGQWSLECPQCGGGALEMACPICDGTCGQRLVRAIVDSQDYNRAHWIGGCGYQCTCSAKDDRIEARFCPHCGKRTLKGQLLEYHRERFSGDERLA